MNQQKLSSAVEWQAWAERVCAEIHEVSANYEKPTSYPCVAVWCYDNEYSHLDILYVYPF